MWLLSRAPKAHGCYATTRALHRPIRENPKSVHRAMSTCMVYTLHCGLCRKNGDGRCLESLSRVLNPKTLLLHSGKIFTKVREGPPCCICQGSVEACRLFSLSIRLVGSQASPQETSCHHSSYLQLRACTRWEYVSNSRQHVVRSRQSEGHKQHAQIIGFASRHQPMQAQAHTYQSSTKKNHNNEMSQTYIVSGQSPGELSRQTTHTFTFEIEVQMLRTSPVL